MGQPKTHAHIVLSERTLIAAVRYALYHPSHFVKEIGVDISRNISDMATSTLIVMQRDIIDVRTNSEDGIIGPSCDDSRWDLILHALENEIRLRTEQQALLPT